jgi:hypothetical protein
MTQLGAPRFRSTSSAWLLISGACAVATGCSDGSNPDDANAGAGNPSNAAGNGVMSAGGPAGSGGSSSAGASGGRENTAGNSGAPGSGGVAGAPLGGAAGAFGGASGSASTTGGASGTAGAGGASGVAGTSGSTGGAPLGSLVVSNLKIEANPRMSLSCYVSWTSSEAGNSEVRFGTADRKFRIVDERAVTEHRLHVVGMHPRTAYEIEAVSTSATATGSAEGSFTTGDLPMNLPAEATLVADAREKMLPGWTLTNYYLGGSSPAVIVIVDEEGVPIWYFVHGTTSDQFGMTSTAWLPNGRVLVGNASAEPAREVDLEGNVHWEGPSGGSPALSHHTSKLASGNYLVVRESNASARVEEIDAQNAVVWSWDLYDYVEPKTTAADWCHLNSVSVDEARNELYFNCRFQGLFGVSRTNKELLWQLGAAIDDSNAGDVTYLPDNGARFNDAHDPEVHPDDGTVLLYDNAGWPSHMGGENNGNAHSRVVEYRFDRERKEATLTWEFPGDFAVDPWYSEEWSTPIWGDANRLANGNVLVTAGARGAGTHTRIFEVTRAGEVVWGIEWPEDKGSYRANRIAPPPAEPIP